MCLCAHHVTFVKLKNSTCIIRYMVKEGGQWRQGVGAKAAEFSHQVLPQLAVHQRHSQVLFRRGQQFTVICPL